MLEAPRFARGLLCAATACLIHCGRSAPNHSQALSVAAAASEFLVNDTSEAMRTAHRLRGSGNSAAAYVEQIAAHTVAVWYGDWSGNIENAVRQQALKAQAQHQTALMVAYNIPHRDCGQYSSGGLPADRYRAWIAGFARGIGQAEAMVVLEPDAIAGIDCLSGYARSERNQLLTEAVKTLKAAPHVRVFLDGGHAHWQGAAEMAKRLGDAGIAAADGFSLNVSNYGWTADNIAFGSDLRRRVHKDFIIDTDRNGNGPDGTQWCNPWGRALGPVSTMTSGVEGLAALAWIHNPGESDGTCNGGPAAGVFWVDQAVAMAKAAHWNPAPPAGRLALKQQTQAAAVSR